MEKQSPKNKSITFRKLRDIGLNDFKSDITNSQLLNNCALPLDVMVKNYNTTVLIMRMSETTLYNAVHCRSCYG